MLAPGDMIQWVLAHNREHIFNNADAYVRSSVMPVIPCLINVGPFVGIVLASNNNGEFTWLQNNGIFSARISDECYAGNPPRRVIVTKVKVE